MFFFLFGRKERRTKKEKPSADELYSSGKYGKVKARSQRIGPCEADPLRKSKKEEKPFTLRLKVNLT